MLSRLCFAAVAAASTLVTGCAPSVSVPPVTASPTGSYHPGKIVWYDLLAHDLPSVERFYGELFGWAFDDRGNADPSYVVIRSGGRPIGGVARIDRLDGDVAGAQWISWVSVPDVDGAVAATVAAGGTVLRTPRDLEERGRAAVIADPEGAPIALLRSESGDPADARAAVNEWLWTEFWTWDATAAQAFYGKVVGYDVGILEEPGLGTDYPVFRMDDVPRAGIIQLETAGVRAHWVPYVRVADPGRIIDRVEALGGRVLIPPSADLRSGSVALIADPGGAPLVVQQWPIPGQEGGQ
jgi:predicted enzyme related to lactoylglutathione lyase